MRKFVAAMLLTAVLPLGAHAEDKPDKDPAVREAVRDAVKIYVGCIMDSIARLEPSGEAAAQVADAAITSCKSTNGTMLKIFMLNEMVNEGMDADRAYTRGAGMIEGVENASRKNGTLKVMEIRAAKAK